MKILVDINNKILKVLENDRSIFKGEQSADKLILYINQQLVNEYPVITGLLSNGRRIGPFTTDSSYGTETIDGTTYTTAEFTLSKENGFTLTEGNTQVTIWIYKTKDTEVISKTAIGNVTFNVVNTTSFNDGDIIISGDVEGTVVNIKVELENLQSSVNAVNSRVNNLNGVVVKKTIEDISNNNKTLQELYDEFGSCFVGKLGYNKRSVLFLFYKSTTQTNLTVCHGSNLKTYENVNMNLNVAALLNDSSGNPTYSNSYTDKEIDELITDLGRSKVSIYTPSYSITQGDEVVIRKRLTYDILTQPYTSSVIVAGGKYIAILDVKGGPYKQVKLFDFISNTYFETSVIDTSKLTDYNTISFSTKSYYDKSKIDSLMLLKADKSTTYTKTEVDEMLTHKVNVYAPSYVYTTSSTTQVLKRLMYDLLKDDGKIVGGRPIVLVGKSYIAQLYVLGGPYKKLYFFDFTTNTIYYTNDIDTSTLDSYEDVIYFAKSYYDSSQVSSMTSRTNLISKIGNATESLSGVMSAEDKKNLNTLVALLQDDENNITDTIKEVLAIFEQYPEGANLVELLGGKADKADTYTKDEVNKLLANAGGGGNNDLGEFATGDSLEENRKLFAKAVMTKALEINSTKSTGTIFTGVIWGSYPTLVFAQCDIGYDNVYIYENSVGSSLFRKYVINVMGNQVVQTGDYTSYTKEEIDSLLANLGGGGINEEDVMNIIEENAEQTSELAIGTSETFDAESDEQVPTSKAITNAINIAKNSVNENITKLSFRSLLIGNNYTSITSGDNINLAKYMQVGVYYGNNSSSTIVNCPTANKFKMEVFDIIGNNDRNPETQTWVYRVRMITDFNGEQWVQTPHSANTAGSFTNVKWEKKLTDRNFALIPILTATNTHTITLPSEGIYLITYSEEASEVISNPKTMSSYIISYRPGYTTRSNDDGVAVCSCSATGEVSNARVIEADWQVYRLTNTW